MSHNNSLVAVGAGEDQGWGEKPPTSRYDLLVAVVKREGQGWGASHQQVITTRWWLEQGGPGRGRTHQRVSYLLVVVVKREGQGWGERTTNESL